VLVVDDEADARSDAAHSYPRILGDNCVQRPKRWSCGVHEGPIDLLLTDVVMPNMQAVGRQ